MGSPAELRFEFPNHMEAIAVSTNIVFMVVIIVFGFCFFVANIIVVVDSYHCHVWCLVESVETLDGYDYKVTKHDV